MTIDIKDKQKAKEFAVGLQSMAVWPTSLASSTEPGEVECVCVKDGSFCGKNLIDPGLTCTRAKGHEGPCVSCGLSEHDITGALKHKDESIDLEVNNPDIRPEWWRELEEGEVIQKGDVLRGSSCWRSTSAVGRMYVRKQDKAALGGFTTHYRLRPWRYMEEGEVIQEGDEFERRPGGWYPSENIGGDVHGGHYRTRRPKPEKVEEPPKEPDLRLPDGTDISGWPVIERGELMYKGDARFYPYDGWRLWEWDPIKVTAHEFRAGNQFRRRVLPCRHCGGEAAPHGPMWYCPRCDQAGPSDDPNAVKWNQQNRKEEVLTNTLELPEEKPLWSVKSFGPDYATRLRDEVAMRAFFLMVQLPDEKAAKIAFDEAEIFMAERKRREESK